MKRSRKARPLSAAHLAAHSAWKSAAQEMRAGNRLRDSHVCRALVGWRPAAAMVRGAQAYTCVRVCGGPTSASGTQKQLRPVDRSVVVGRVSVF